MYALRCACVLLIIGFGHPAPTTRKMSDDIATAYLKQYGYMDSKATRGSSQEVKKKKALEEFQSMAGIPVTGILDDDTLKMMSRPRCGNKDKGSDRNKKDRIKRYVLLGGRWRNNRITYRIKNFTPDMSPPKALAEITRAFKVWSDVTPLEFVRVNGRPDIDILFGRRYHGDWEPFDGPGGTLAHAYFPWSGGDAHFDDDEKFTHDTDTGINLFQVAAHEFGHSLGLAHSEENDALMAPFYPGYIENFKLHPDDVAGIQALYGVGGNKPTPTEPTQSPPSGGTTMNPAPCEISSIDAALYSPGYDRTYMFIGDEYYRLNDYGMEPGFPRKISLWWPGFEGKLDAALASYDPSESGALYFFKATKYWKWVNGGFAEGYPKTIGVDGFFGVPAHITTAFVWSGYYSGIYFMKGKQYYRLTSGYRTPYENRKVMTNYPRGTSDWRGLPAEVSAATRWKNRRTYFFSGEEYTRFHSRKLRADRGYPKSTARYWLGCNSR